MNVVLEIPRVPPSLNQLLRLGRRIAERQALKKGLWLECLDALRRSCGDVLPPAAREPRRVEITVRRARLLDHDNLVGGCKPLLDVLVDLNLLVDDRPAWLEGGRVRYRQEKAKRTEQMTRVEITWEEGKEKEDERQ